MVICSAHHILTVICVDQPLFIIWGLATSLGLCVISNVLKVISGNQSLFESYVS